MIRDAFDPNLEIALLLLKEGVAVGDQILQITKLGPVNRRIVNLSVNAVSDCEP
jgi:hypothetical protein